jgi:hypothetical protein
VTGVRLSCLIACESRSSGTAKPRCLSCGRPGTPPCMRRRARQAPPQQSFLPSSGWSQQAGAHMNSAKALPNNCCTEEQSFIAATLSKTDGRHTTGKCDRSPQQSRSNCTTCSRRSPGTRLPSTCDRSSSRWSRSPRRTCSESLPLSWSGSGVCEALSLFCAGHALTLVCCVQVEELPCRSWNACAGRSPEP